VVQHGRAPSLEPGHERRLRDAVRRWRDELINLTRANRLLYFKHTRTASLEITTPGGDRIIEQLDGGKHWIFQRPVTDEDGQAISVPPRPSELATDKATPVDLQASLRALERRALDTFNERGLWTLYLGLGCLSWIDPGDGKPAETPLLLYPVRFNRTSVNDDFRLWASDEDVVINPALAVKLANDFGIELPALDDLDAETPSAVQAAVARAVSGRSGWAVRDRCVLHPFAFAKEAMYRDLIDNEEAIVAHPIVRALALGADAGIGVDLDFEPPELSTLDDVVAPEDLANVLDADGSQRRCVLAAKQGHSFVMDGPPGTGKSQTITNIIAELVQDDRRVLFVSEKAAALDVVESRLEDRGLAPFVLELHSHKASRREVAKTLGLALSTRPRASQRTVDVAATRRSRQRLSDYAQAVTERRRDLDRSVAEVVGRLVALRDAPDVPLPSAAGRSWDAGFLTDVLEHASRLGRAWGPVARGDDFVWRNVRDPQRAAARTGELERLALDTEQRTTLLAEHHVAVLDELDLPEWNDPVHAHRLVHLLGLLDHRPDCPPSWLSAPSLDGLDASIRRYREDSQDLATAIHDLEQRVGDDWRAIGVDDAERLSSSIERLGAGTIRLQLNSEMDRSTVGKLRRAVDESQDEITAAREEAKFVADAFGIDAPPATLERTYELGRLGSLVGGPNAPERTWLDPAINALLAPAQAALSAAATDARSRADALRDVFRPGVVDLDLRGLRARFTDVHKGLRKLGGAYRTDKRTLSGQVVSGKVTKQVIARLDDAIAYQDALGELTKREATHAGVLGSRYYHGVDTDFGEVEAAIAVASDAVKLARGEAKPEALRRHLTAGAQRDERVLQTSQRIVQRLDALRSDVMPVLGIDARTVGHALLDEVLHSLADAADTLTTVDGVLARMDEVAGRALDLALARLIATLRVRVATVEQLFEDDRVKLDATFGSLHAGSATDWPAVERAVAWAGAARDALGGRVSVSTAQAMMATARRREEFEPFVAAWSAAMDRLIEVFDPSQSTAYREELRSTWDDSIRLLAALAGTSGDITEWAAHQEESTWLAAHGFDATVDACVAMRCGSETVRPIVERAFLNAWLSDLLASDKRLGPGRSTDRDALVAQFQALDAAVVAAAAPRVISVAADRRPASRIGEVAIIDREAQKQRRHMPIRELFHRAGSASQRLKPVFMMSPLAVSTYLPPTMRFDTVIFDEASQVRPSDAINCIYRADQVIVAGDQRQLPPTSFFDTAIDDGTDTWLEDEPESYESVLDLCKASASVPSLPLMWHYRSQHEALIAFSNRAFYDGLLATFPAARHSGEDVGIEVFKVDGIYERGGRRTNPVEATKVVERLMFHRREHPELSLGVVAFSASQQAEILTEVERAAITHPELNDLVAEDRLHGFFVKNLENVQGDERDVIIFSIGYGPDAEGKFTLNLGPVSSKAGGWRRLNVAITRARRRVELITSILPSHLERASENVSLVHLRNYLDFALRGRTADHLTDGALGLAGEIAQIIRGWGYDVDERVGLGDDRVDVAVHHPTIEGEYVLGVECDEPDYARSTVARDRDRLRPNVLERLGWHRYHAWSTAWFLDRVGEERRLQTVLNSAIDGGPRRSQRSRPSDRIEVEEIMFSDQGRPEWVTDYRPARIVVAGRHAIDDPRARNELMFHVRQIVEVEGPVHIDLVIERLRQAWGVQRIGQQVRSAINAAISTFVRRAEIERHGSFLSLPEVEIDLVRAGSDEEPGSQRKIAHIPPDEIDLALSLAVDEAGSVDLDELKVFVTRAFGWKRMGADISAALDAGIRRLQDAGSIE
jgi:hypothetical protein